MENNNIPIETYIENNYNELNEMGVIPVEMRGDIYES